MAVVCTNVASFRWAGSHAVFKIRCAASGADWEVERRHRDFVGLSRVAREARACAVAPFPRIRGGLRKNDAHFNERRREALDRWLKGACISFPGRAMDAFLERPRLTDAPSAAVARVLALQPRPAEARRRGRTAGPGGSGSVCASRWLRSSRTPPSAAAAAAALAALWATIAAATFAAGLAAGAACACSAVLGALALGAPPPPAQAAAAPLPEATAVDDPAAPPPSRSAGAARLREAVAAALQGAPLPTSMDDDAYLEALLARRDRGDRWARDKVVAAAAYRRRAGGGKPAPMAPRLLASLRARGLDAAGRDEPLVTEERVARAGRTLRGGGLYVLGRDAAGRPVVWARTARIDLRNLGPEGERDWVDAVATLFELCALAGGGTGGFTYVEDAGPSALTHVPFLTGWRILRGGLDALTTAFPERGAEFFVAGAARLNRVLFSLAKPLMPATLKSRILMLPYGDRASAKLVALLGGEANVPDFLGGPRPHDPPRAPNGDLDFAAAFEDLLAPCPAEDRPGPPPPATRVS